MKSTPFLILLLLALAATPVGLRAQRVVWHPEPSQVLGSKWQWAAEQAAQQGLRNGYWVGYSIERLMGERAFIGSWSSRGGRTTLHEMLYGEKPEFDAYTQRGRPHDEASERKVVKDVAVLFAYEPGGAEAAEVRVTNVSGAVDLKGRPLLWLGGASDAESLDLVQQRYRRTRADDLKEDLVMATAMHQEMPRVVAILADVLTGKDADAVRKSAAFWLGQQDDAEALDRLQRAARADRSEDVRKQAVFAISQTDLPAATEALIDLARAGTPGAVRKDAIFWLGQKASERAVEALGDLVRENDDTDVQKQAVFAISQLPDEESVPLLIDIARTHGSAEVRKQAIFWLGQSEDPRALEAIIEMARG